MRIYVITYKGVWLKGKSVISAPGPISAKRILREELEEQGFEDVDIVKFEIIRSFSLPFEKPIIIFNDDGDY